LTTLARVLGADFNIAFFDEPDEDLP